MRKTRTLLILGIWVTILPYLGFPYSWKDILTTISGFVVIYYSYVLYKNSQKKENAGKVFDNFRENNNFQEEEENTEDKREIEELLEQN